MIFKVISSLFLLLSVVASQRHFNVRDLVALDRIGEPIPNNSGTKALFTRWRYNSELNQSAQTIWIVDLSTNNISSLTNFTWGITDSDPVWIDDVNVGFLSTRSSATTQAYVVDSTRPDVPAYQMTNYPLDVSNLKIFNSRALGRMMAFSARVYHHMSMEETLERDGHIASEASSAVTYDSLYFRHWNQFNDHKYNHIFVVPIQSTNGRYSPSRSPVDLLYGHKYESPVLPFGGISDFSFSPDGGEMAFVAYKPNHDMAWQTDMDIYVVQVSGTTVPVSITASNIAQDSYPVYSPDGLYIAYLAMRVPKYEADRRRVMIYDRNTGTHFTLTESWDRSPESIVWSLDSKHLYVTAQDVAKLKIFEVNSVTGFVRTLVNYADNIGVHVIPKGLIFNQNSQMSPNEVFTYINGVIKQVTHINKDYLNSIEMNQPEEFWFRGTLGDDVHGWIIRPPGFNEEAKYPIAFLIHGGPQSAWIDAWSFRWNPQLFAGAEFVVVAIDPHGSTSYGQEFCDAINGEWGSYPYEDLMLGLDFVLNNYNFVDPDRVTALGASYGGYMINWINGHTNRFQCLVNHCGLWDTETMYYTTEELFFPEYDFRGTPYESDLYEKWNPSNFVSQMKTPTLVVHGALDYRVVDGHGFSTFTSLQRQGVRSRLVYFPNEGHWVTKPGNIIRWYDEVLDWITECTSPNFSKTI